VRFSRSQSLDFQLQFDPVGLLLRWIVRSEHLRQDASFYGLQFRHDAGLRLEQEAGRKNGDYCTGEHNDI